VVIPTYNRSRDLIRLFESLLKQLAKPVEVLVVDDTPTFEIKNLCEKYRSKFQKAAVRLVYVKNHKERSISIARNLGAKRAFGDILIFLDSDISPHPDYVKNVINAFNKNPNILGVGGWFPPLQKSKKGLRYYSNQVLKKLFSLTRDSQDSCRNFQYPIILSRTIYCQYLLGSTMSFRRSVFNEFQFDDRLKGYSWGEDFLFSNLITKAYPNTLLISPHARCINYASNEARLKGKALFDVQISNAKYILTKLWGLRGLLLFGRQFIGLYFFRVIIRIRHRQWSS
jgi:glycosyltransferase involved in cell wall biosynthesis